MVPGNIRPRALTVSAHGYVPVRTGTASRLELRSLQILDCQDLRLSEAVQRSRAGKREGPYGLEKGRLQGNSSWSRKDLIKQII
jgi:hypothetical protein